MTKNPAKTSRSRILVEKYPAIVYTFPMKDLTAKETVFVDTANILESADLAERHKRQRLEQFEESMQSGDYEGMLRAGLRRMTMTCVGGVPYRQTAARIVSGCPAATKRQYPLELLRLAYELYLEAMALEYEVLMQELEEMIPSLPLPEEEVRKLRGEWLIVSALPKTRDAAAVVDIYTRAAELLEGKSRVIDAYDSITAGLHGFPGAYLMRPGTADSIAPHISRVAGLFSGFTGEKIEGMEELYGSSLAYYRGEFEEAKRLAYKALYLLQNTSQSILQISAGEMIAFIAMSQQDVEGFSQAIDYMKLAAEKSATPFVCRGVVDLCRCGLLNTIGASGETPGWIKALSFSEGTLTRNYFGEVSISGNAHFAPASSVVAFWHHTIYLATSGQYQRAAAVSEIMLQRLRDVPVLSICFLFSSACCYLFLGDRNKAVCFAKQAVALALEDRLYTLISDFAVYLDGIVEQSLKEAAPEVLFMLKHTNRHVESGQKVLRKAYAQAQVPESLTDREKEVAKLAAQSLRNTDIAEKLGISANTVKAHLKAIYGKLDIDKRSRLCDKLK